MGKYLFKIILAGSPDYQKTNLLNRYTQGQYNSDTKMTIGVDFAVYYLELQENQGAATLQIWDFGGEERFRTMIPSFCHGSSGALLFFDLLFPLTLDALDEWVEVIRRNTRNIPIIVCGTNYSNIKRPEDLDPELPKNVMKFIKRNELSGYISVDVKTGFNINKTFDKLTELMIHPKL